MFNFNRSYMFNNLTKFIPNFSRTRKKRLFNLTSDRQLLCRFSCHPRPCCPSGKVSLEKLSRQKLSPKSQVQSHPSSLTPFETQLGRSADMSTQKCTFIRRLHQPTVEKKNKDKKTGAFSLRSIPSRRVIAYN